MIGYTDFNFVELKPNEKLIRNDVFILAEVAMSHLSKFQSIIALLTCEAKYITMYKAGKKAVWLEYLLAELEFRKKSILVILYADN